MTGIFQIFDRYKSKSYAKNDSRRSKNGDSDVKAVPKYYLVEGDGVARRAPSDQAWSEASRDSRRSSSADISEVVVKTLAASKEPQNVQKPHSARPSTDSQKPSFAANKSRSPRATQSEASGYKDTSKIPESYLSDAVTPKSAAPSRSSVDHRVKDGSKLPPRDTRSAFKPSSHRDRSRTTVETVAYPNDARDISRAIMQMREPAQQAFEAREAPRLSSSVTRRDVQRYHSSGDEREGDRYRRDGRSYQSSGDERDGHRHLSASETRDARRYSSVAESYEEHAFDDEPDHHRPQFPSEGKEFLRSWHVDEGLKTQAPSHIREIARYMSSGDEMDSRRSNLSSGDERGARRFHQRVERRDGVRHRASQDPESNRSYWPMDNRDGLRHQSGGDAYESSTGDERVVQRPYPSTRSRRSLASSDERGHKHPSSKERAEGRRIHAHDAGREIQGMHFSGDERGGQRRVSSKDVHRRDSSGFISVHKHQAATELNNRHRHQSVDEEKFGNRHHTYSAKGSRHQSSTSSFEGPRYHSSGDERGTHRMYASAEERGGKRHEPPLDSYNGWRNESSDEDREVFPQPNRTNARDDARRYSSVTDVYRRYSSGNEDAYRRYSSSNDEKRSDRSRSSVREGRKYESVTASRGITDEYQHIRSNDRTVEWVAHEANVAPSLLIPAGSKEVRRRNSSVESRGERRQRGSNSSIASQEAAKLRLSVDTRVPNFKEKESPAGYSRDLPPRSSARDLPPRSPRSLIDIRDLARLNVQVRESTHTPAPRDSYRGELQKPAVVPETSQLSSESVSGSYDLREILRAIDFKDSQWASEKLRDGSSRNSVDGRDPPRTSNVSRVSVDSRQYQSSTPRLSVDGREHLRASSLHSSRASSVDAQVQLRTNSMDSSSASGEFKRRGPSVVARLMGLAELPDKDTSLSYSDKPQGRDGKLSKKLSVTTPPEATSPQSDWGKSQLHLTEVAQQMKQVAARLHQDSQLRQKSVQVPVETRPKRKPKTKSKTQSRSRSPPPAPAPAHEDKESRRFGYHHSYGVIGRLGDPGSPLPRQPMSPKHHQMEGMPKVFNKRPQELSSGDLDQRLHQLRIKNSIQEHRTLKQILEAMHLKGLLHPPQKKPPKSPRAELLEQGFLREEAQRPLHDFASSSLSNMTGSSRKDYQEQLTFEDLIRMDPHVQEEPALDIDHTGEASIVLMKPVNYHSSRPVTPPPATKDVDFNSETSGPSGFEREKIEIRHRGRGSERRAGSSGRASRSHSLESLEKRSADKVQVEDQSFANVMLSWRERIAADAARKASIDMAEAKPHSRSKSSTPVKHRSREVSPLQYDARDAGSTERRAGSRSPRPQASIEEYLFNNREENDALSRKVLSDAQEYSSHDEDKFKMVGRSKSDLQVSAASTEAVDAMDASLDKVSAQVSVVRNKRTSVKSSRSKDKHRASHPGDLNAKASSKSPSSGNTEASSSADQVVQDPILDLKDHKESSSALNSTAQEESLKIPDVDSRVTPKKRKTAEPVVMLEEEKPQLPRVVTPVVEVKGPSNEEEDFSTSVEVVPNPQVVPSAHSEQEQEEEDVKMEDAFDGTVGQISEGFSSGRDKCFSEDGALGLQGADHPSPVSVLDSPIYREEFHLEELSASPDSVKSVMAGHEDVEAIPHLDGAVACEPEPEVLTPRSWASKDTSDPLRDIYTKLASTLEMNEKEICRGQLVADLQIPFIVDTHQTHGNVVEVISVEKSKERLYVQSILTESGLTQEDSRLTEDAAEIMQFEVFTRKEEELQTEELERIDRGELEKTEELRYKESLDRRLIFDCMNEILERKMSPYLNPQPWGTPVVRRMPRGQRLIDEVWDELKDMHWPTSAAYDALYAVLQKDFMRKSFQWLDFSVEVGDVGCELESMLLQELVEELVQDIFSIELKLVKELCQELPLCPPSPLPVHHSPLHTCSIRDSPRAPSEATSEVSLASPEMSPVSSDDSVRRRRELLDKTRRDLLAWHVQYQQL